ncbi:hypothetical protein FRC11_009871 [Ceratobasidium sp. 423]|nr:hypothetical protein FRC11_009871 [Ceratobasidium sp. 423]
MPVRCLRMRTARRMELLGTAKQLVECAMARLVSICVLRPSISLREIRALLPIPPSPDDSPNENSCFALAAAQDTTVQCTYADWTTNARGQNPCLVWAELQTKCDAGGVRVTPLTDSRYHYTQPDSESEINDCNCSVVAYNLMAACTWCQLGLDNKWINETLWRSNCPSYNARGLSIDTSGLTIAEWAKIPVDGGMWRPNIASLAATPPTVTPTLASTTFSPQSTADTHTQYSQRTGHNAGAIAGYASQLIDS